jgi:lipid-binding SYLF domain-containing protein
MMKMTKMLMAAVAAASLFFGTAFAGWDPAESDNAQRAIDKFRRQAPTLERFFLNAYGYAVFPDIFKGGFIILGGAHGKGYVYELNNLVGRSRVTQVNFGPQLGGQSFAEIIFFKSKNDLDNFKKGNYELSAQVTGVVVRSGMATNTDYSDGVAVFAMPNAGVMAEATIGGQKFTYTPTD